MTQRSLSAEETMAKAKRLTNAGNLGAAASLYQKILAQNPQNKKASKALKALQKKTQGGSRTARLQADMNKLMQLYSSGMYDQAYSHAAHLARVYPEQPVPPNIMGVIQANRGDAGAAVSCYEQALKIEPNFVDAINNLGSALLKLKEYDRAVACFRRLIRLTPEDADAHTNLGKALLEAGSEEEAIAAYNKSIAIRPLHGVTHYRLGRALDRLRRATGSDVKPTQAIASYRNAIEIDPTMVKAYVGIADVFTTTRKYDMAIAWYKDALKIQPADPAANRGLASSLLLSGKREDAVAAYKHCLELEPESQELRYFLSAAEGISPDLPPREYVEGLFENYAQRFERHLVEGLGYRSPQVLQELIKESGGVSGKVSRAIDLGCGTGLCGEAFKDMCETMTGVDLSRNMLLKAEEKGCYTELHRGDVTEVVRRLGTVFDLYICADMLIYIGDVAPLFNAIGEHSRPGTLFVFSTELGSGEDFKLLQTGRYAHSKDYVERAATDAGFTLVACQDKPLRKESGQWLTGGHYLFRYTETS